MPLGTGGIFIQVENVPIEFVIIRASSIPDLVTDQNSTVKAGVTGSDIIWEAGMAKRNPVFGLLRKSVQDMCGIGIGGREFGEYLPVDDTKNATLYIGVTKNFAEKIRKEQSRSPKVEDLEGWMLATKYPRIAYEILTEREVMQTTIFPVRGTDESMQYVFPNCVGILGVMSSGETVKQNEIELLEAIQKVTIHMIEKKGKMSRRDADVLDDVRNRINRVIQERKYGV